MLNQRLRLHPPIGKRHSWLKFLLVILSVEKAIQHIVVTVSFYLNISDIRARVVPDYNILMAAGGVIALLFVLALWLMFRDITLAIKLLVLLAAFDIAGEFIAQGTIAISITVSFIIAVILLFSALAYEKSVLQQTADAGAMRP